MLYYQKNDAIFYQFDPSSFTYTELFDAAIGDGSQMRIMKIKNQKLYEEALYRASSALFQESTEEIFMAKLASIKSRI